MKNTIKDDNLLTTSSLAISRRGVYLGVSVALLLTGCSMPSVGGIFSDERDEQRVEGARHAPVYNNRSLKPQAESPSAPNVNKLPPMVTNITPKKDTSLNNPYDQYDANGNEVEVDDSSASNNTQPDGKQEKSFFSGWFGSDEEATKEAAQPNNMEKPAEPAAPPVVRKSFIGNPYNPKPVSHNQPLVISPQLPLESKTSSNEPKITFNDTVAADKNPAPDLGNPIINAMSPTSDAATNAANDEQAKLANAAMADSSSEQEPLIIPGDKPAQEQALSDETLLGRIGSKLDIFDLSDRGEDKPEDKPQEQAAADYPDISSVPQRPEAFDAVNRDKQQNFNELQSDHTASQKQKESLEREAPAPSEPAKSEPASKAEPKSSIDEKKIDQIAKRSVAVASKDNVKKEVPVLSEVAAFVAQPAETPAAQAVQQTPPPAPFLASEKSNINDMEENKDAQAEVQPDASQSAEDAQPGFFDSLINKIPGMKPSEEAASDKVEEPAPVAAAPVMAEPVAAAPAISEPVSSLSEINIEAKPEKKEESHEEAKANGNWSSGITEAPAIEAVAADPAFAPVNPAVLPSPDLIKTMRPSRYEARRAEASGY